MTADQTDIFFDQTLIEASLTLAGQHGWHRFSLVDAARNAGLPIEQVRARYPFKALILLRLNRLADEAALCVDDQGIPLRDKLFDLFMRRFDAFQDHREGLRSVLHSLPRDPGLAALLGAATLDSLRWIADSAGLSRHGLSGAIRLQALMMVWTHALRAWEKDDAPDLSETMSALDKALDKAERLGVLKMSPHASSFEEDEIASGLPDHTPPPSDHDIS
ncbi:TetR family transcriptional regulator [Saccharibacter sp. 17.LH.SD]|uniref:TetR family transcriptional regulator n=1 Tax=Saccharibacter sp. 17.LH.SD TaxID=2689393 RepID=UPI00192793DC|nr:TetR family transcriptional regulator [Saccharibacter sp. 17.LH.SD]